jgi:epoxyqueuosine reductase
MGGEEFVIAGASDPGLEALIKAQGYGLGFELVGITELGPATTADAFDSWLARGYEGEMSYMSRWADKRRDSRLPFDGVTSAIVVAMNYGGREPSGPVARYARGDDYHDVMVERLRALHRWINERVGREVRGKAYVDTGPILERDLGRRAGLGWFGKNTMLINPKIGSFFFLASLFVDLELEADTPFAADHCGTCRRCIDACPTGAIVEPHIVDATKCVSYLTIELKSDIPEALRSGVGDHVYGCDVCQDVCPWNEKFALPLREEAFRPRPAIAGKDVATLARELLAIADEDFRTAFKGSPMKRAKLRGLKRNAAVVLGNVGDGPEAGMPVATLEQSG